MSFAFVQANMHAEAVMIMNWSGTLFLDFISFAFASSLSFLLP